MKRFIIAVIACTCLAQTAAPPILVIRAARMITATSDAIAAPGLVTIRGDRSVAEENGHHWLLRERRPGPFQRSLSMGTPIDADKASAQFEDGVLTLTLPKSEQARPKPIKFSVGTKP